MEKEIVKAAMSTGDAGLIGLLSGVVGLLTVAFIYKIVMGVINGKKTEPKSSNGKTQVMSPEKVELMIIAREEKIRNKIRRPL